MKINKKITYPSIKSEYYCPCNEITKNYELFFINYYKIVDILNNHNYNEHKRGKHNLRILNTINDIDTPISKLSYLLKHTKIENNLRCVLNYIFDEYIHSLYINYYTEQNFENPIKKSNINKYYINIPKEMILDYIVTDKKNSRIPNQIVFTLTKKGTEILYYNIFYNFYNNNEKDNSIIDKKVKYKINENLKNNQDTNPIDYSKSFFSRLISSSKIEYEIEVNENDMIKRYPKFQKYMKKYNPLELL